MSDNKLLGIIVGGFFGLCGLAILANYHSTKRQYDIIKYAVDKGAQLKLSKKG